MKYHLLKNIFIASLMATIYWSNLIAYLPIVSKIIGTIAIFVAMMFLLTNVDQYFDKKRFIKRISKKRFPSYKNHLANIVEQKRAKNKDSAYLTGFIKNFIAHDKYSFTGEQIKELLDLAKED